MNHNASDDGWREAVYAAVAAIPDGRVVTYGMLAAVTGAPRWWRKAAQAVARAPAGLPCHRVVHADGSLAPMDAFPEQRALLLDEGVRFTASGRVALRTERAPSDWFGIRPQRQEGE